jgi:hypothetical protein
VNRAGCPQGRVQQYVAEEWEIESLALVPISPLVLTMIPAEELMQRLLKVVF